MITVLTLLKVTSSPNGHLHGERPFWREVGQRYLEAWLANVDRYIPEPKRVVVMTDAPVPAPWPVEMVLLDRRVDAPGFWAKLNVFRAEVSSGTCLYLDLDNVITGPLADLCALRPDPLIMLDDRRVPGLPNGSAMLFDAERCRGLWTVYAADARAYERYHVAHGNDYSRAYDQAFVADCATGMFGAPPPFFQDLLPRDYVLNAIAELPRCEDWRQTRLIFGSGLGEGKPHTSTHPAFTIAR